MEKRYFYQQAPVGNKAPYLSRARSEAAAGFEFLKGWSEFWMGSGTMALAAALEAALADHGSVVRPKVALAAYGCPDLVSAIRFVGAEPLYIDTEGDRPCMELDALELALEANANVVAVIGVDLFGISERWEQLRQIIAGRNLALIQDCAQSVQPMSQLAGDLTGDMVVFSFGRGKPVYLGGGGLLLGSPSWSQRVAGVLGNYPRAAANLLLRNAKIFLYNLLIRPSVYPILSTVMGDRLGQVRFRPLRAMVTESEGFAASANKAIKSAENLHIDSFQCVHEALQPIIKAHPSLFGSVIDTLDGKGDGKRYLRYPILIKDEILRQAAQKALRAAGISATLMYRQSLPDIIAEADGDNTEYRFPKASTFADQLVTLPVHGRLTSSDIGHMRSVLLRLVEEL